LCAELHTGDGSARKLHYRPAMRTAAVLALAALLPWLGACASRTAGRSAPAAEERVELPPGAESESLTRAVSELRMYLGEDSYRFPRPRTADGRDLFESLLWQLDRLRAQRSLPVERWQNADLVIEFARARALEKLRRYADASEAYARVAGSASVLAGPALEAHAATLRLAQRATPPAGRLDLEQIQTRVREWRQLAWELRETLYEPLAREEAEAWQVLGVDWLMREGRQGAAIESCRALIEQNRDSKLYGHHLIRLGDLFADELRRARRADWAGLESLSGAAYDHYLDQALSAYELASDLRRPEIRSEARARIHALLAFHEGTARVEP
jgi:hypothetical protein